MRPDATPSDAPGYFCSRDEIVDYLAFWMKDGSPREIARAVGDVARSQGLAEVSFEAGDQPHALGPALSPDGNPTLELLLTVLRALELELSIVKITA